MPPTRIASSSACASAAFGSCARRLRSRMTGARANNWGAAATFCSISSRNASGSLRLRRRLAMPTWPNFSSRMGSAAAIVARIELGSSVMSGDARLRRGDAVRALGQPGLIRQAAGVEIFLPHELEAAQFLREQRHMARDAGHVLLADFAEAVGAVEQHGDVVARFEEHLAGEQRHAHLGEAGHVRVEYAAKTEAAVGARDDDAVDVEELRVVLAEPEEVVAGVVGVLAQADEEAGEVVLGFGDAEIGSFVVELAHAGRVQRQDRGTCGVVELDYRIQFMLANVANCDAHADVLRVVVARGLARSMARIIACVAGLGHDAARAFSL